MKRELLLKAGIDYNAGVRRFLGDHGIFEEFLFKFLDDPNFRLIGEALQSNDIEAAFCSAHALKGVAGNLSMVSLHAVMVDFVEALRNMKIIEPRVYTLYESVRECYEETVKAIKESNGCKN